MDVIKATPDLQFDVIYADGTRKRVQEGVLLEAEADGGIVLHNGTDSPAVWLAAAETMLLALLAAGDGLKALAIGMALTDEAREALTILTKFSYELLNLGRAEKQAVFRLGQMDMQQSILSMIQDMANNTKGLTESTLLSMAEMIEAIEVQA